MPSRFALIAVLTAVLAVPLAGCANQPLPGQNPTPARSAPAAPPPTGASSGGGGTTTFSTATPAPGTGVTLQDEQGGTTQEPSNEARQKDAEDCYTYAQASVARDIQVQDDRSAIFDESSNNRDVYAFTNRLDEYGNQQRRGELYDNCMTAKGYGGQ